MAVKAAGKLKQLSVQTVAQRVEEISTLPHLALRVIEIACDPKSGGGDLKRVIEADPALTARILRLVNSAAYGLYTRVTNLQQAVSYLGFKQVRNLAMTASVAEIFKDDQQVGTYSRTKLWQHLVSVGIAARLVAKRCRMTEFENAFVAGLLHDIGLVLCDQHAHEHFRHLMRSLRPGLTLADTEREILGFTHCELGEAVAQAWRFSEQTRAAIRHHHASHEYDGPSAAIVHCVEIANAICSVKGITSVGVNLVRPPVEACRLVGFDRDDVLVLASDLDGELERHRHLFEL